VSIGFKPPAREWRREVPDAFARLVPALVAALLLLILVKFAGAFDEYEAQRQHRRLQALPLDPPHADIVIIGIEDAVFQSGRFNRVEHSKVIDKLTRAGVRQIFMDIMFDEPRTPDLDLPLAQAVQRSGRVVLAGAYKLHADADMAHVPPQFYPQLQTLIEKGRARLGVINTSTQVQKRTSALVFEDNLASDGVTKLELSAGAAMLAAANHLNPSDVELRSPTLWRCAQVKIPPLQIDVMPLLSGSTHADVQSYGIPLRFHPPSTGTQGKPGAPGRFSVRSYLEIADADDKALADLRNKFILIGENTQTDNDVLDTPAGRLKGVEVHATVLDALLRRDIPHLPLRGSWFGYASGAAIIAMCYLLARSLLRQPSLPRQGLVFLAFIVGWEWLVWWVDKTLYLLPQTIGEQFLILTALLTLVSRFLVSWRVLRTFIPEEIVHQLLRGEQIHQGTVNATVMVTDIRGYTTLSESRTPRQVLELLNDYHEETVSLYKKFGGHVLNYQGDAQIILFGHPKKLKDAPLQAILAAQAASGAVERLRRRWNLPPDQQFNVGAGICTGRVVIADLGHEQREYTVIGETVRKGHKLQSQSQVLGANIILDEQTYEACQTKPDVVKREGVTIDGLPGPMTVYITDLAS
jgi:adenylate cyclase